jgi:calcineurin-like phosphoesterase
MNLLCLGDVVGTAGCDAVRRHLSNLKRQYKIDFTVINGENSADGNGILPGSAESLFDSGADVITTGNHVLRRKEIYDRLDEEDYMVRETVYGFTAVIFQHEVDHLEGTLYIDRL